MSVIMGTGAAESLAGAGGNDTIQGLSGNDTLQGLGGNDSLDGGFDDNLLEGGEGNDTLNGSFDDDTLLGGAGDDLLSPLVGANVVNGGPGRDTLVVPTVIAQGSAGFVDLTAGTGTAGIAGSLATFSLANVEDIIGTARADTLIGNGGANAFFAGSGNDSLVGGAGNDTLDGQSGSDTIDGGAGIDAADYTIAPFPINVQQAAAAVAGPAGDGAQQIDGPFVLIVTGGNDTDRLESIEVITGSVENDTIFAGGDLESVFGGDGNDTVTMGLPLLVLDGGNGTDRAVLTAFDDATTWEAGAQPAVAIRTRASDGSGSFDFTLSRFEEFGVGDGPQVFNLPDYMVNLTIIGGQGQISGTLGQGNDAVSLTAGAANLDLGPGNDTFSGGQGADQVLGGAGNDSLDGGGGNDSLVGGLGTDQISGGAGSDTAFFSGTRAQYVVADAGGGILAIIGPDGDDFIFDDVEFVQFGSDPPVDPRSLLGSTELADERFGGAGADIIDGRGGNDTVNGNAGNDSLDGGADDDTVNGDADNDTLDGGDGNDSLKGGTGNDEISGGNGSDTAFFSGQRSQYVVLDFGGGVFEVIGPDGDDVVFEDVEFVQFGDGPPVPPSSLVGGPPPTVSIEGGSIVEGDTGTSLLTFTIRLSAVSALPVQVLVNVFGGTATALDDFLPQSRVVTIPPFSTTTTLGVEVFGDAVQEPDESFSVVLSEPENAVLGQSTAFGQILDDDLPSNDTFQGGDGLDTFDGGDGNDTLSGGGGPDSLAGGEGNDSLAGENGEDTLAGGDGNDSMDGGNADDLLAGGNGNDSLDGGAGDDVLNGGAGDDAIIGGGGNDTVVFSGARDDYTFIRSDFLGIFFVRGPDGNDTISGIQFVKFGSGDPVPIDRVLASPLPTISVSGGAASEGQRFIVVTVTLDAPNIGPISVRVGTFNLDASGVDDFTAQDGTLIFMPGEMAKGFVVPVTDAEDFEADESVGVLLSDPMGARLSGVAQMAIGTIVNDDPAGRPTISLAPGGTVAEGATGNSTLFFAISLSQPAAQDVTFTFSTFSETATAGIDYIDVSTTVTISAGQTSVQFGVEVIGDVLIEGDETFVARITNVTGADPAPGQSTVRGTIANDDSGTPPAITGQTATGVAGAFAGGAAGDRIGGDGGGNLLIGGGGSDIVDGGAGNDLMFGDGLPGTGGQAPPPEGAAMADPPGGNDDSLVGGDGGDTVLGGFGEDTIAGGAGDDFLVGDGGDDSGFGGLGNDVLFGFAGDDYLFGEDATDFLFGDAGANTLDGGAGNDRIHINAGDVLDSGGDGIFDVAVILDVGTAPFAIDLGQPVDQNVTGSGPALSQFEAVDASISTAPVSVNGAVLNGFGNVLFGSFFDDTIVGSALADIILGNPGPDILIGAGGNDTIIADAGDDTLAGGNGADDFFHAGGGGNVGIADFVPADDTVLLAASLGFANGAAALAAIEQIGTGAVLLFAGGGLVALAGVNVAALTAADFEIV